MAYSHEAKGVDGGLCMREEVVIDVRWWGIRERDTWNDEGNTGSQCRRCGEGVGTRVVHQFDEVLLAGRVDREGWAKRSTSGDGLGVRKLCAGEVSAETTGKYTEKLLVLRS